MTETWRSVYRLAGSKVILLVAVSIPAGIAIGLLESALGLSFFLFLKHFGLVAASNKTTVFEFMEVFNPIGLVIFLALTVAGSRAATQLLPSLATELFQTRIRETIADNALSGVRERSGLAVSDVSNILGNLANRSASLINSTASGISSIFLTMTILVSLSLLSWKLTLGSVLVGIIVSLPLIPERLVRQRLSDAISENLTSFMNRIVKDVRNVHFLRVSGANESELSGILVLTRNVFSSYKGWLVHYLTVSNMPPFLGITFGVAIVWINSEYGIATLAVLVPFVYLLSRLAGSVGQCISAMGLFEHSLPFLHQLTAYNEELFPASSDNDNTSNGKEVPVPRELVVENLIVGRKTPLLRDLSFKISSGQTLLISGESGKGKTTLLMTLIGLIEKIGGEILWNGIPCDKIDPAKFRTKVAYAGPDPYLFDGTIRENLLFGIGGGEIDPDDIDRSLKIARADFVYSLNDGLEYKLIDGGANISAGQQQRLALARALLRRPHVFLMDEATANIDEENERGIMEGIHENFSDLMILAVSHRSSMKRFATVQLSL